MKNLSILIVLSLLLFTNCKKKSKNNSITCNGTTPKYNNTIKNLFNSNCTPCHAAGGSNTDYSTYQKLSPILTNGKFKQQVITDRSMPTNGTISDSDLSTIQCWIDNGFPEN